MYKYLLIIMILSLNCVSKSNPDISNNANRFLNDSSSVKRNVDSSFEYEYVKHRETKLKLTSIESGKDSIEIRLWINYPMSSANRVFIVKCTQGKWSGQGIYYRFKLNDTLYKEVLVEREDYELIPLSGWKEFAKALERIDINKTIIDTAKKSDLGFQFEGTIGNVEIATSTQYLFKSRGNAQLPEAEVTKDGLLSIIVLFDNEFNTKYKGRWYNNHF